MSNGMPAMISRNRDNARRIDHRRDTDKRNPVHSLLRGFDRVMSQHILRGLHELLPFLGRDRKFMHARSRRKQDMSADEKPCDTA